MEVETRYVTPLTPRQREVLAGVARGLTNRQIAERLVISHATVENHLHNIFGRLGVKRRAAAAVLAIHLGILNDEDEEIPS